VTIAHPRSAGGGRRIPLWTRSRFYAALFATAVMNLRPFGISLRGVCTPGFHCHGCPAATATCPVGAVAYGVALHTLPAMAIGGVLAVGILLGRLVCAFACPFGLLQDVLHRIPGPKFALPRWWRWGKYAVLALLVCLFPYLFGFGVPGFLALAKPAVDKTEDGVAAQVTVVNHGDLPVTDPVVDFVWKLHAGGEERQPHAFAGVVIPPGATRVLPPVELANRLAKADLAVESPLARPSLTPDLTYVCTFCPAGALEAALPAIIATGSWQLAPRTWVKLGVLAAFLVLMWLASRPFCRGFCPLGAAYALTARFALVRIELEREQCISCGSCDRACPAELDVRREVGGPECIACGDCIAACPTGGIRRRVGIS
jgi:ferredoxin